jgi:hypothetical protein
MEGMWISACELKIFKRLEEVRVIRSARHELDEIDSVLGLFFAELNNVLADIVL